MKRVTRLPRLYQVRHGTHTGRQQPSLGWTYNALAETCYKAMPAILRCTMSPVTDRYRCQHHRRNLSYHCVTRMSSRELSYDFEVNHCTTVSNFRTYLSVDAAVVQPGSSWQLLQRRWVYAVPASREIAREYVISRRYPTRF